MTFRTPPVCLMAMLLISLVIFPVTSSICIAGAADEQEGESTPNWLDRAQGAISKSVYNQAVWFDNFFGSKLADEEGYPATFGRIRFSLRWSEDEHWAYRTQFHLQVHLPKVSGRLKVIVTGKDEGNINVVLPGDPAQENTGTGTNIALRYEVAKTRKSKLSTSLGMSSSLEPYVRARYRHMISLGTAGLSRLTETAYYRLERGFEETSRVDLEKFLDPETLLRWTNSGKWSEENRGAGLEWFSEFVFFHRLTPKDALTYRLRASGITQPGPLVKTYRADMNFRRNFYREWLFYEVEPEIRWIRDDFGEYTPVGAITARLEVQFRR
ncbi:MAG: hypothetical protein GXP52_00525 [Deltaproteobacteria bacterium]|nr:hypothetical protein [Deltaproteobacteria bacterium]